MVATARYQRTDLYPVQEEAYFHDARYGLVEAAPQTGKTTGAVAWLVEQLTLNSRPGHVWWWLSPTYTMARVVYRETKRGLPLELLDTSDTEQRITLPNDVSVFFKGADRPDTLYGQTLHGVVLDEASRISEDAWVAALTRVTRTGGPLRILGNKQGRGWFWQMCQRAKASEPGMHYVGLTAPAAVEAGILDAVALAEIRRTMPEARYRELYLLEDVDDANPFGYQAIRDAIAPLSSAPAVAFGVDLAKSVDWTVIHGLDAVGHTCHFDRWQRVPWDQTIRRIADTVGSTPTLVDSTGIGDPVLEAVQREEGVTATKGFTFTSKSRQQLLEGLAVAIQQGKVRFPDGMIVTELDSFSISYGKTGARYEAPPGAHDDCVMALALAVEQNSRPPFTWL